MEERELLPKIREAIKKGNLMTVVEVIRSYPQLLNVMTTFGTWLHVAATAGNLEIVKKLVELGIDINQRGGTLKGSALDRAASEGHVPIVKYLLDAGAEVDVSEPERNPLFAAIYGGHLSVVEVLVENGIDLEIKYTGERMKEMDALAFALERNQLEIARFLQDKQKKK